MYKYILGIDPSGDGASGLCLMDNQNTIIHLAEISATSYQDLPAYWEALLDVIKRFVLACRGKTVVVIEDFLLNTRRAYQFKDSRMETSQLLGVLQFYCTKEKIPYQMIKPIDHRARLKDQVLCDLGFIERTPGGFKTKAGKELTSHTKDAIRLSIYYNKMYNKGGKENE